MNLIKQIITDGKYGEQTIRMIVRSNERGAQGEQGEKGDAATITAGQAYSVPANTGPSVMNVGTSSDAVFDFYIPRGKVEWSDITGDITTQADLKPYLDKADTALQPDDINYTVMQDLSVNANGSTSVLQLDADKVNLETGATTTKNIPLTVASHEKAGVMNSATFDAVVSNSANINTILNGMVAISGLPSSPTQSELTTAWKTATGLTELANKAQILDVDNDKYWTYYTNTEIWYAGSADIQVSVSTFTNDSEGTIKGSTTVGQVYAESNGTGSVNGWDSLSAQVADNTANKLGTSKLTANGGITKTTTGSGANTAINMAIADGGVTTAKIADANVTEAKFAQYAVNKAIVTARDLSPTEDTPTAWSRLLGASGLFKTRYSTLNQFAHQLSQYGELITINTTTDVVQLWLRYDNRIAYRAGTKNGWRTGDQDGSWLALVDNNSLARYTLGFASSTNLIPSGADLTTNTYCQPGEYVARQDSVAQSLSNCPTSKAFRMTVFNMTRTGSDITPTQGQSYYINRVLFDVSGEVYVQHAATYGTASWSFSAWQRVVDTSQTGTVSTAMIADGNISRAKLANECVAANQLASGAVTTAKITDSAVTTAKIGSKAVTAAKIADSTITSTQLTNSAVTGPKINWTTLGYAYKTTAAASWTPTSTSKTYPSGWDFSFTAVSGGVYEIECCTSLLGVLTNTTPTTETSLGIDIVSGATSKASVADDALGYANGQQAKRIIQASSTTVKVKAYVASTANKTVSLGSGLFTVKRVA